MLKLKLKLNLTVSFPRRIIGSSAEQAAEKSEEQKTAKRDLEGAVAEGGETVEPILDAFGAYSTCAMFTVYNVRLAAFFEVLRCLRLVSISRGRGSFLFRV